MSTARAYLNDEIKRYRGWLRAEQITESEFRKQMESLGLNGTEIDGEMLTITASKERTK